MLKRFLWQNPQTMIVQEQLPQQVQRIRRYEVLVSRILEAMQREPLVVLQIGMMVADGFQETSKSRILTDTPHKIHTFWVSKVAGPNLGTLRGEARMGQNGRGQTWVHRGGTSPCGAERQTCAPEPVTWLYIYIETASGRQG